MTHDVQNVLVKHGTVRFCLATDNRHVVFAFVTRIPGDRHHFVFLREFHHGFVISEAAFAMLSILVARQNVHTVISAELTDNHRHALIDKICFHLAKLVLNLGTGALVAHSSRPGVVATVMHDIRTCRKVVAPVVLRVNLRAPINNVIQQRVGIRVIEMHFDHQAVCNHILRELAHRHHFATAVDTCRWPLNHERTASIVATRRTHGIHKRLVIRHQDFGFVFVIVIRCRRLVSACKKQVFVVILEAICNLRPEILLAGVHLVFFLVV